MIAKPFDGFSFVKRFSDGDYDIKLMLDEIDRFLLNITTNMGIKNLRPDKHHYHYGYWIPELNGGLYIYWWLPSSPERENVFAIWKGEPRGVRPFSQIVREVNQAREEGRLTEYMENLASEAHAILSEEEWIINEGVSEKGSEN